MHLPKLLCLALPTALVLTPALHATQQKKIEVRKIATSTMAAASARQSLAAYKVVPRATLRQMPRPASKQAAVQANQSLATDLVFGGFPIVAPDATFVGFDGLNTTDSADVTGFVVEPPDQGLATNGTLVAELINNALRIFTATGTPLTPPISDFALFGVSTAPNPDGTSNTLSDPRVFYDWESGRWFVSELEYTLSPAGALTGGSEVLIAVTNSSLTSYSVYSIDVSDATFGACPCLGDQPLLGLNQDGVYLNTNEYSTTTGFFQTALVTAINKRDLIEDSSTVIAVGFDGMSSGGGPGFSIQPAFPAPGQATSASNGTEFFTMSMNAVSRVDNRVAVWSLTNTRTLIDNVPNLNFQQTIIPTETYSEPVPVVQKVGPYPLGMSLGDPEETLDPGDDRMQQLFYSGGKLYCALNTSLLDPSGQSGPRTGGAWFAITPTSTLTTLSAKIASQGYVGIANGSVLYPAFAVSNSGKGIISFTLSGENYFPSTGYVDFSGGAVTPKVHLAGIGQVPEDGFSGYPQFGGDGIARWGDYGAAMVAPNGTLFGAAEYIPNPTVRPRTPYTNFGTYIFQVH